VDKRTFRSYCLKMLKDRSLKKNRSIDKNIEKNIEKIIKIHNPRSILFYLPLKLEVDLTPLLKKYRKKLKILIPKVEKESFKMVEYRLPLEENNFKILEKKFSSNAEKKVDMIIVPIVGMDANMQRVGFGKGMYDRFFDSLKKKPIVVFVQRYPCLSCERLCDKHDIYGDYFVTSKEKIIGKKYDRFVASRIRSISRRLSCHTRC